MARPPSIRTTISASYLPRLRSNGPSAQGNLGKRKQHTRHFGFDHSPHPKPDSQPWAGLTRRVGQAPKAGPQSRGTLPYCERTTFGPCDRAFVQNAARLGIHCAASLGHSPLDNRRGKIFPIRTVFRHCLKVSHRNERGIRRWRSVNRPPTRNRCAPRDAALRKDHCPCRTCPSIGRQPASRAAKSTKLDLAKNTFSPFCHSKSNRMAAFS